VKAEGVIERLIGRMRPFIASQSDVLLGDVRRDIGLRFPIQAVREAVINALVHRDWTRPLEVAVTHYADRLEITSPGSLQNAMTIEKMLAGQRTARNPIIMEVMRDYGYVEQRGMGVRRKVVPLTREHAGQDAQFEATEDYLKVVRPARR
jgi:ATP-dependent DNA helicase RecG